MRTTIGLIVPLVILGGLAGCSTSRMVDAPYADVADELRSMEGGAATRQLEVGDDGATLTLAYEDRMSTSRTMVSAEPAGEARCRVTVTHREDSRELWTKPLGYIHPETLTREPGVARRAERAMLDAIADAVADPYRDLATVAAQRQLHFATGGPFAQ